MLWNTFLFHYGLLGILARHFKWVLLSMPINLALFGVEKVLRFTKLQSDEVDVVSIWGEYDLLTLFYV